MRWLAVTPCCARAPARRGHTSGRTRVGGPSDLVRGGPSGFPNQAEADNDEVPAEKAVRPFWGCSFGYWILRMLPPGALDGDGRGRKERKEGGGGGEGIVRDPIGEMLGTRTFSVPPPFVVFSREHCWWRSVLNNHLQVS